MAALVLIGVPWPLPAEATTVPVRLQSSPTTGGSQCSVDGKAVPCDSFVDSTTACQLDGRPVSCDALLDGTARPETAQMPTPRAPTRTPPAPAPVVTTNAAPVPTTATPHPHAQPSTPARTASSTAVDGGPPPAWQRPLVWAATALLALTMAALAVVVATRRLWAL